MLAPTGGVGSDVDTVVVVRSDERSFDFHLSVLPASADIMHTETVRVFNRE